jgi:hypothetical protein
VARWKVGASLALPVAAASEPWDSTVAATGIFALCGFSGPWGPDDAVTARKGFLCYDAANPSFKGSYKLAFAKVAGDGVLVAVPAGLVEAGRALEACSLSSAASHARSPLALSRETPQPLDLADSIGRVRKRVAARLLAGEQQRNARRADSILV